VRLVLVTVFLVYLAQMILNPIIAPLSREIGLREWQVGLMISTAALTMVLTSQAWGRRSLSWGRKPVLVTALVIGTVATAAFALLALLGTRGLLGGATLFALMVLTRGLGVGLAVAAVAPTAQAYIADVTPTEAERVRGMAAFGATQGMSMVAGAAIGGLLAAFGLLVPVTVVPLVLLVGTVVVLLRLRPEQRHELVPSPPRIKVSDARVWPFLLVGFGMFTALGFIQVVTGFLVQDRLGLDARSTGVVTGLSLLGAGIGMVLAQGVVVPRSGWHPRVLLRVGSLVALMAFALLLPDLGTAGLLVALTGIGFGLGIAMPGYSAGPSLLMSKEEQGGMAGLLGATTALTFVVAPTAATVLYTVDPSSPLLVATTVMLAVVVFVLTHPRFRRSLATESAGTQTPVP